MRNAGRPPSCRNTGRMSGVLVKKFGRKYSFAGPCVSSVRYSVSSAFRVAPGEIGIGLREPGLGQRPHHLRPGERLGQEHRVRAARLDLADHPFPERHRLGVRVVDAENAHPLVDPEQHDIAQFRPQPLAVGVVEIDVDDVLVFLRRVLGEFDRPVGAVLEPLLVLAHPGVVGGALDREIERDLHAALGGGGDKAAEIGERAEIGIHRRVAALRGADRVGAAGIVRARRRCCCPCPCG